MVGNQKQVAPEAVCMTAALSEIRGVATSAQKDSIAEWRMVKPLLSIFQPLENKARQLQNMFKQCTTPVLLDCFLCTADLEQGRLHAEHNCLGMTSMAATCKPHVSWNEPLQLSTSC